MKSSIAQVRGRWVPASRSSFGTLLAIATILGMSLASGVPEALGQSPQVEIESSRQRPTSPIFRDANPGPPKRYFGEHISLSLRNADLVEVLRSFAQLGQFNLLVQPGVRGKVTVELKDVPWDQALEAILKIHGLGIDFSRGTARIGDPATIRQLVEEEGRVGDSLSERQVIRGRLEHVDTALMAQVLNRPDLGILSLSGYAFERDGDLIIAELPARIRRVSTLVARLDRPDSPKTLEALSRRALEIWKSRAAAN